jgi:hypothetical protein
VVLQPVVLAAQRAHQRDLRLRLFRPCAGFVETDNCNNHAQVPVGFLAAAARHELAREAEAAGGPHGPAASPGPSSAAAAQRQQGPRGSAAGPDGAASSSAAARERTPRRAVASRLLLAARLGLSPQQHVFKLVAGRPPPALMTAFVYVLLAPDSEAAQLRRVGRRADAAARAQAAAAGGGGSRRGRGPHADAAAVKAVTAAALSATSAALRQADVESRVARVLEAVASRMLGRYTCGLEEDERLLRSARELPPRLAAAVLARKPEKEALVSLASALRADARGLLDASLAQREGSQAAAPKAAVREKGVPSEAGSGTAAVPKPALKAQGASGPTATAAQPFAFGFAMSG